MSPSCDGEARARLAALTLARALGAADLLSFLYLPRRREDLVALRNVDQAIGLLPRRRGRRTHGTRTGIR
ncbi:putative protein OS=Streptomyces fumanus OX=67302 GN=GCM10018772_24930 PE=4 SV=1 [Streptomyces fumanus]|uniref:Uncharacterized protein n=1 Tax=Streptomyces fumanus TaxID=67302 RepID=A0A919ACY7_9ACTN|nr:hypothetical protein GCM10018772_24930 [Streptomyces fumanus]